MKLTTCIYLVIFSTAFSYAQQRIDTLVEKKIKITDSLARITPKESLEALTKFYTNNENEILQSPIALEQVYYALSKYNYYVYDLEASKKYLFKGKQLIKDKNLKVASYYYDNLLGAIYGNQEELDSAAFYFTKSANELAALGQYKHAAQINYNIGSTYRDNFNLPDAYIYYRKCLDFYNKVPDSIKGPDYSFAAGAMSYFYEKGDSLKLAVKLAREAIEYGEKFKERNGWIYGNLALSDYFESKNKEDSTLFYSKRAYEIARTNTFKDFYPITAIHLAKLYAEENPEYAVSLTEEVPIDTEDRSLRFLGNIDELMGKLYSKTGSHAKANFHLSKYIAYRDSIVAADTDMKAAEILEKYKAAEKELKIAEQEAEITEKENQRKTLLIISLAIGLLALLSFLFFRQRQKTQQQKIVTLENERENVALRSLMAGEEQERSRIAKELHDGLGGILAAAKMHASKASNAEKVTELLDTASKESRRISHNLLPESLILKGLDQALKDFIKSINDSGLLKAEYESIQLQNNLPQSLQLSVYRIIQELVNNIIKHAGASEALIQLQQQGNQKLLITVEDNGKGFAHETASNGIGLENIKSRLSLLKGKLDIDSQEKKGTSVYIELELNKE